MLIIVHPISFLQSHNTAKSIKWGKGFCNRNKDCISFYKKRDSPGGEDWLIHIMILKLYFREENTIDKSRLMSSFFYICEYLNVIPQGFFDFKGDHADGIDALVDQLDKLDEEQIQALTAFIKTIVK